MTDPANPLIVQSDLTVLLETSAPTAASARGALARFAELEKAPEHVHTYRITPLSLWNAAVAGLTADEVAGTLVGFAKYDVADVVLTEIADQMGRYGRLRLVRDHDTTMLALTTDEPVLLEEVGRDRTVAELLGERLDGNRFAVRIGDRGALKQALLALGWPVADEAGFDEGAALAGAELTAELRSYQGDALAAWWQDGSPAGGSGVLALPCGAGKTVIGLGALVTAAARTLIVCTSISAARQWIREILDKTTLDPSQVGEWSGQTKDLRDVTVATYQVLTWADPSAAKDADLLERHPNLALFDEEEWGLVVYDEVHLLPAPVFRATARIQAVRRLGLTATLIREDGREGDVFSLIGPKRFDAPWKELEALGWIAPAVCTEVRVELGDERRMAYAVAEPRQRHRVAATSPEKVPVLHDLLQRHEGEQVLVIGQFVDQLRAVAGDLGVPLLTGATAQRTRDERFAEFRDGTLSVLVVSKIANFSIDLPEASVAIQLSGQFGSRQEEAQRLGRLLRPKADGGQAHFYSLVAADTEEARFARKRQRFLTEQGYTYQIISAADV
jgi:DNA excision repair protein ERCC-3